MKKILTLTAALAMILVFASCKDAFVPASDTNNGSDSSAATAASDADVILSTPESASTLPNPIVEVDSAADFAVLGFVITAPETAENVHYSIINDTIAQITFTQHGMDFVYRAANTEEDISGVYDSLDPAGPTMGLDGEGFTVEVTTQTIEGGDGGALSGWVYDGTRYSFYTPNATTVDEMQDIVLPIIYQDLPFAICCG